MTATAHGHLGPGVAFAAIGSGKPLVFLPGAGPERSPSPGEIGSAQTRSLRPYARHFTAYAVLWRPDAPTADTTMADVAADIAQGIRATFGRPVPVVGMSTGGSIALQLAADHPDVVERLVVICGAYRLGPVGGPAQRRTLELARAGKNWRAWHALARGVTEGRVAQWTLGALSWLAADGFSPSLLALLAAEDRFDLGARLGAITAPTLIVGGGRDRCYSGEHIAETARGIPGARLLLHPRRGHLTTAADPHVPRAVLAFLRAPTCQESPA